MGHRIAADAIDIFLQKLGVFDSPVPGSSKRAALGLRYE